MQHQGSRQKVTAIGGLGLMPSGRVTETFTLQRQHANAERCFWWLVEAHRHYGRPLIVVWDGLPAHRKAAAACRHLEIPWIEFEFLPPYAPELNPVELLWSDTKHHSLANWSPRDVAELQSRVDSELSARRRRPKRLRSYLQVSAGTQNQPLRAE